MAQKNVSDVKFIGNPDTFQLLCQSSSESEGWIKSTWAMLLGAVCLVQVTHQQRNPDGSYAISEAICVVENARIELDVNGGKKLVVAK